jgi:hypothetical protein
MMVQLPPGVENQLKVLQAEVERLQADNRLLGAKLKEALSVQPAAVDPRELAKAEERIRALQKENALFKTQLEVKDGTIRIRSRSFVQAHGAKCNRFGAPGGECGPKAPS